jgi:hypothetical protein
MVAPFPQRINAARDIQQEEIEVVISLQNQVQLLTEIYNREAAALFERLESGARLEMGPHTARLEHVVEGGVRTIRLAVR